MRKQCISSCIAALLFVGSFGPVRAQVAPAPARPSATKAAPDNGPFLTPSTAGSQNLARAEQEDEEYVFKHSSSVRAFGNLFHLSPDAASLWFWGLNFILLAVFVGYFLVKLVPRTFRARRHLIENQLVEARTATEQANTRLQAVEERLGRLDSEIAAIRASAERDTRQDEQHIKASMEEERRKIIQSAESEIAAAGAAAERRLRTFAAELAVERASRRIQLSDNEDRQLIRQFARGIPPGERNGGRR